jgi:hypothetical protein
MSCTAAFNGASLCLEAVIASEKGKKDSATNANDARLGRRLCFVRLLRVCVSRYA